MSVNNSGRVHRLEIAPLMNAAEVTSQKIHTPATEQSPEPELISITPEKFSEFHDACSERGAEVSAVPETVSGALKTAMDSLRKAALYEWLTKSMKAYRGSLETQMRLV